MARTKRILPPSYFFAALLVMAALHFLSPVAQLVSYPWQLLGLAPLLGGVALELIADSAFKKHRTTVKPFEKSAKLITDGVFYLSRNPMYLGFVLILVGMATLMGSLTPYAVIPVFAVLLDRVFVKVEERMLEEKFGQAWLQYKASVRRWI